MSPNTHRAESDAEPDIATLASHANDNDAPPKSGVLALGNSANAGLMLQAANGAAATLVGEVFTISDAKGGYAFEFDTETGVLRILAIQGDLRLAAPKGRVVLESGKDVVLNAEGEILQTAGRRIISRVGSSGEVSVDDHGVTARAEKLGICAGRVSLTADAAEVSTERLTTTSQELRTITGRLEIRATRIIENARDVLRSADGLLQTRAQRIRTIARETVQVFGQRVSLLAKDDVNLDGKRVRLG